MTTRYLSVLTRNADAIEAYPSPVSKIFGEHPTDLGKGLIIEVVGATDHDAQRNARYLSDRLASGLHGGRIHATEAEARDHLISMSPYAPTPA